VFVSCGAIRTATRTEVAFLVFGPSTFIMSEQRVYVSVGFCVRG
jgi:hypothetical protein